MEYCLLSLYSSRLGFLLILSDGVLYNKKEAAQIALRMRIGKRGMEDYGLKHKLVVY